MKTAKKSVNDQTPQQIKLGQLHVVKVKRHTKLQLR